MNFLANGGTGWSEAEKVMLKELWFKYSCVAIGEKISKAHGTNRKKNSVIGQARRLGLEKHIRNPHKPRAQSRTRPIASWTPAKLAPPPPSIIKSRRVRLFNLERNDCRWISTGVGHLSRFCGAQTPDGESYCPHHLRIVYNAPRRAA